MTGQDWERQLRKLGQDIAIARHTEQAVMQHARRAAAAAIADGQPEAVVSNLLGVTL